MTKGSIGNRDPRPTVIASHFKLTRNGLYMNGLNLVPLILDIDLYIRRKQIDYFQFKLPNIFNSNNSLTRQNVSSKRKLFPFIVLILRIE